MIKLDSVHIEELRGIRCLDVDFGGKTFAISGPNGSGKSGIIDAIEFGLTGEIGRLTGPGTKGLSLAEHGPHVDRSGKLDSSFVRLSVTLPKLKRSATITRTRSTDPIDRCSSERASRERRRCGRGIKDAREVRSWISPSSRPSYAR